MLKSSPLLPVRPKPRNKTTAGNCAYRRMSCETNTWTNNNAFERSSKRRKGYPSETKVKRGRQVVHGEKEFVEKLGRNDLCPCGSGRRFQALLPAHRQV